MMTTIRTEAFAGVLQEYLEDPAAFEQERYDASLYTLEKTAPGLATPDNAGCREILCGLCFAEHIELVMILLRHGFSGLTDRTTTTEFSRAVAEAIRDFAEPLADGAPSSFPDPSFLLHGLVQTNLEAVIVQIASNGRTIHQTMANRDALIARHGSPTLLDHGIKRLLEHGCCEDYFGICSYLTLADEMDPHGTDSSYIAKTSFFLDRSGDEIIVMTMQGQRVKQNDKKRSRDYARLAARLRMDPRAWSLLQVCEIGRREGYRKVKVLRPSSHPMYLDHHNGFMGRYEPVIRQAGVVEEYGCYLRGSLFPQKPDVGRHLP